MAGDILIAFALQVTFTVGTILLFGWLISLCNKKFYSNFGRYGRTVCYVTGFIGTPVHELSHALLCVVFGHRITEIKLFQINSADGTLGYVNHTYNRRNAYQLAGNFFIGVAPVVCISALLYLAAWLLMPGFAGDLNGFYALEMSDWAGSLAYIWQVISGFFSRAATWQWWVFVFAGMFLALHMNLSGADIRSAAGGLAVLLALLLAVDFIVGAVSPAALDKFTAWMFGAGCALFCFLLLSLIISLLAVALSYVFRFLKK